MEPMLKREGFSQERKMALDKLPRFVVCPVCETRVPYAKRGAHRCLKIDFHEMDSKIQRGLW
jgi:hypothetical protein